MSVSTESETQVPARGHRMSRLAKERPEPAHLTVRRRTQDGTDLGEVELPPEHFGIVPNVAVLHQVVTAQLAAARAGTHSTRTRAEVRGGGSKPYRQKGTGRARQGSIRAPQHRGGGIAHGPEPREYAQRTPKKMIRLAVRSALSDRGRAGRVALVDHWEFETPRTKDALLALGALGLEGRVLVVAGHDDLSAQLSFRNLPRVHVLAATDLNAYDVMRSDWVVFTDETLPGGPGHQAFEEAGPKPGPERSEPAGGANVTGSPRSQVGRGARLAGERSTEDTDTGEAP